VIAADYVSKQPGDGNTLLMAHINSHALAPAMGMKLAYDAEKDFVPISMVGITPNVLICNQNQPSIRLADRSRSGRAKPGTVIFASARCGLGQHFALEIFKLQPRWFARCTLPYPRLRPGAWWP
jgi:tripartite-type tricarboxylate transporter receptor subunit TctC